MKILLVSALTVLASGSHVAAYSTFTPSSFGVMKTTTATTTRSSSSLQMNVVNGETKPTIKVGVIGMGRIGLVHLEAITKAPGVTPVIVSNPTVSKAENGKKKRDEEEEKEDPTACQF